MTFTPDHGTGHRADLEDLDRIERSVDIDATPERVWALVSVPGWWINEGDVVPNDVVDLGDGAYRVVHPAYGEFRLRREEARPVTYVRFGWDGGSVDPADSPSTTVEFFVVERPGGVTLRVVESGWTTRDPDRERWLGQREENVTGWAEELDAARRHLAGAP